MHRLTKFGLVTLILEFNMLHKVHGAHFQFPETDPCEIADIDATFHLSYQDDKGHTEVAPVFTLDSATVYNDSSTCVEGDLEHFFNFNLQPSGERLSLRFSNNNSEITMFVTIRIDPSKHFKDLNQSAVILPAITHLTVGDPDHSYKCISEQMIKFANQSSFSLTMTIKNVQIQAFNVTDSSYSPAVECDQDAVSTEEPISDTTSSSPAMTSVNTAPETIVTASPITITSPGSETTATPSPTTGTTVTPSSTSSAPGKKKSNTGRTVGIAIGVTCGCLIVAVVVIYVVYRIRQKSKYQGL